MLLSSLPSHYHTNGTPCRKATSDATEICQHAMVTREMTDEAWRNLMHTKRCLAGAVIAAVENLRDQDGMTHFDFRIAVQDNAMLSEADGYLRDGLFTCICD